MKGAKSPLRVQSIRFLNFEKVRKSVSAGRKDFFDTLKPPACCACRGLCAVKSGSVEEEEVAAKGDDAQNQNCNRQDYQQRGQNHRKKILFADGVLVLFRRLFLLCRFILLLLVAHRAVDSLLEKL